MSRTGDDLADVRSVIAQHVAGDRVGSFVLLGEGLDHTAYEVDGELIVRFGKEPDPAQRAARVEREARLLAAVATISPLPVPVPKFTVAELGCLAYSRLPGQPLLGVPRPPPASVTSIATALGELLAALHAVPPERMTGLVGTDDQPPAAWLQEAVETYEAVVAEVPAVRRSAIETFLAATPPALGEALAFSHNDLGIEHVLVDPEELTVTGVIDWSDAAVVDPAYDFGLLHRDLGPGALDDALAGYRAAAGDPLGLRERAAFYACCKVLEDLAYGIEAGQTRYVEKSLSALDWLFPR